MTSVRGAVAALLAALVVLPACTTSPPEEPPPSPTASTPSTTGGPTESRTVAGEGGTLRYALGTNPASIDPRFLADEEGTVVADALFDSLVAVGDDLVTIEPAAARSWTVSDDGLTHTFRLRPDATFHDGTPVRAQDFVRAFRRIVDREARPASFLAYQLAPVEGYDAAIEAGEPLSGVRAVDDTTLEIVLSRPHAEFLQVLAHPSLAPLPVAAEDDPDAYAESPVGNGPFAMAEAWQPNQFIRVSRFADHHAPARLDEVVFQIFADDPSRQQQYDDFERGQLDVAEVPPDRLDEARTTYGEGSDGTGLLEGLTGAIYAYGFNTELAPFDDPAVRRAVSHVIDRERIVRQILLDARVAADTLVPPSLPGAAAGRCEHCTFDPEAARAELLGIEDPTAEPTGDPAASPSPTGTATGTPTDGTPSPTPTEDEGPPPLLDHPIEIVVNAGATNERIAARVAADIESALGADVTTRTAEPAAFVGELRAGEIQLFRLGWQADHPSPGAVLQPLFRSDARDEDNLTRFVDEEVDALLDQARAEPDAFARNQLYADAEERILELAPVAPIFFYKQNRVVADTVVDLRIGPLGTVSLDEAWKRDGA